MKKLNIWIKDNLSNFVDLIYFLFCIMIVSNVALSNEWNLIILIVAIGLITFLTIFYQFVTKKEIEDLREKHIRYAWKKIEDSFYKRLDKLKEDINNEKKYNIITSLQEDLESITNLEREIDIKRHLNVGVISLLSSIFLFLTDSITNLQYIDSEGNLLTLRIIATILFLVGFYKTLQLVITRNILINEKPF